MESARPLLGLAYADGVFETMRASAGALPLWPYHRRRLSRSLAQLRLNAPDWDDLGRCLHSVAARHAEVIIKLICYSADGGRGYARRSGELTCLIEVHRMPAASTALRAISADQRLSGGAGLAAVKSLARLEQRLAASQAARASADVALLRHRNGEAVSFSRGNLVLLDRGKLYTPPLVRGAIAGVMRGLLIAQAPLPLKVTPLRYAQLFTADGVFVSNAVRGIETVAVLDNVRLPIAQPADVLGPWLERLGFTFD